MKSEKLDKIINEKLKEGNKEQERREKKKVKIVSRRKGFDVHTPEQRSRYAWLKIAQEHFKKQGIILSIEETKKMLAQLEKVQPHITKKQRPRGILDHFELTLSDQHGRKTVIEVPRSEIFNLRSKKNRISKYKVLHEMLTPKGLFKLSHLKEQPAKLFLSFQGGGHWASRFLSEVDVSILKRFLK